MSERLEKMFDIYSYEVIQAAADERRTRSLDRYERLNRRTHESDPALRETEAYVLEIVFATGCPENDQLSA
jgi:hypothetical protein